jgi:hypothetical protein
VLYVEEVCLSQSGWTGKPHVGKRVMEWKKKPLASKRVLGRQRRLFKHKRALTTESLAL